MPANHCRPDVVLKLGCRVHKESVSPIVLISFERRDACLLSRCYDKAQHACQCKAGPVAISAFIPLAKLHVRGLLTKGKSFMTSNIYFFIMLQVSNFIDCTVGMYSVIRSVQVLADNCLNSSCWHQQ